MKVQYPAFSKEGVLISNEVTATESQASAAREIALAHSERPGPLLLILHAIQEAFGYVPSAAVAPVAEVLSLSRAEVHGVISFYHLLRTEPAGDRTLYVCRAEACQSMGARELEAHAKKRLGIDYHETTADGRISLEPIYCLGNCACSPAVMIDTDVHGRVDAARLDELLAEN